MRKRGTCRKELFVIDEGGIFNNALWKRAIGMLAYRLALDMALATAGPEAAFVQWRTSIEYAP